MSRAKKFDETDYETAQKLQEALGQMCDLTRDGRGVVFALRNWNSGVSFAALVKACAALACAPDDLMFNADMRDDGYCETCSSPYPVLEFWVKAR